MEAIEIIIIILKLIEAEECFNRINGNRRWWVRPQFLDRETHGFFRTNFKFTEGGGNPFYSSAFKIVLSTIKMIVGETCDALWDILGPVYLSVPQKDEWKRITSDFYTIWDLPNCVGAIDGKHVNIFCPNNSGSLYYNYKGNYSIVLLAACDANYTFTAVDIGAYGSQSDGGVMWSSSFGQRLYNEQLDLPKEEVLPGTNKSFPHYFVGDSAFPLKKYLMKPYPCSYGILGYRFHIT